MIVSKIGKPSGILDLPAAEKKFQLALHLPTPDLSFFVDYYWIINWDLRGQPPYLQENLPHPCVHLVFEKANTQIYGIIKGKFGYLLQDKGQVFGVRFRPGGFYPFIKSPLSRITNSTLSFQEAFGFDCQPLEKAILSGEDQNEIVRLFETFLRPRLPERDENIEFVNRIINNVIADRQITRVDDIVSQLNLNQRTLQRIFNQYVGVSPKWVIQRYRLHEVAEQLAQGEKLDWPKIVADLGYFDQAHFIKDFKSIVGRTPAEYARNVGRMKESE